MIIIGLSGKISVGKNYVASKIRDMIKEKSLIVAFADHLKVEVARKYLGVDLSDCLVSEKPKHLRAILQFEGTENGLDKYGKDIWVDRLENWIDLHNMQNDIEVFIIPDCRFKNEAEWIENRCGLLIKIVGPYRGADGRAESKYISENSLNDHISENSLHDYKFKHILNNNGNNNLEEDIRKILKSYAREIGIDINDFLLDC